jgi:hypothetical protein
MGGMTLKVIGAGFGRTGTLSLKLALDELGLGPCYHMIETREHPEHDALWLALAKGESSDWRAILDGYASTVDWPGVMIWKELAAAYPDAKIILTLRDPEAWYASCAATIFARMEEAREAEVLLARGVADPVDPTRRRHMAMINAVVVEGSFDGSLDRANAIKMFNAHNEDVRNLVAPERLLVYESGQGWEPLCDFLGLPVPQVPYPDANKREDFASRFPVPR